MNRALLYIEKLLLLGGITLILIFLTVKIHAKQGHSASVEEVEALIQSNKHKTALISSRDKPLINNHEIALISSPDKPLINKHELVKQDELASLEEASESTPNMSDWSAKRKKDYHEAKVTSSVIGLLEIPQIDLKVAIFDKASEPHLNKGVARVLQRSQLSGEGNLSLAGHRDGFFRKLGQLNLGDTFTVSDIQGTVFNYQVTKTWIVKPQDTYVMNATEKPSVTLITCYPFYFVGSAPERYIVRAERI